MKTKRINKNEWDGKMGLVDFHITKTKENSYDLVIFDSRIKKNHEDALIDGMTVDLWGDMHSIVKSYADELKAKV